MENNLPKGWIEIELRELVSYRKGKKPKNLSPNEFKNSVPYLNIKAVEKNIIDEYADIESSNISNGDEIFVVWDGARSGWVARGMKGAIGSTLMAMKPYLLNTNCLFRFLQTQFDNINSNPRGTGIPHIDPEIFWKIQVPLAPLPEQQRIVEKLDALMARISNSKTRLDKIPTLLKNFRQSVLAAAVSGELTKEWRHKNKDAFTSQINIQRKKRKSGEELEILFEAPKNWEWHFFDDLANEITVGYVGPMANEYKTSGIPFLRSLNIREFRFDRNDLKYISPEFHKKIVKSRLSPGDIGIVRTGNVGICTVIPEELKNANCSDLVIVRPSINLISKFGAIYINSTTARNYIFKNKVGIAQAHFNVNSMKLTPIAVPPIEEQKEIVRKVEELFHFADSIEARYQKAKAWFDKLPQAILAKAFRGELVLQNENDEPASELLKRIQQAKQTNLSAGKAGHKPSSKATLRRAQGDRKLYEDNDELSLVAEE